MRGRVGDIKIGVDRCKYVDSKLKDTPIDLFKGGTILRIRKT